MASSESRRDARRIQSNLEKLTAWAGSRREPMSVSNLTTIKEQLSTDLERLASRSEILERTPVLLTVEMTSSDTKIVTIDMRDGTTRSFETLVDYLETPLVDYRIADAQAAVEEATVFVNEAQARERAALQRADEIVAENTELRNRLSAATVVIDQALPVITAYLERREEEAEV